MIEKLKYRNLLLAGLVSFLLSGQLLAMNIDDINDKAGTSAFPFLKINVSARAVAMGGAFTGLADDVSALYYNPAGIVSYDEENRYILGYHNYFVDIQSGFAGFVKQWKEDVFLAGYFSYLNYGDFIETDELGNTSDNTFSGGDLLGAVSVAYRHNYSYMVGGTIKIIYEKIHEYSSKGIALDIGAKYSSNRERFNAGLAIQNLGKQLTALGLEKYRLPLTIRAGVSVIPKGLPMVLATDLIFPVDNNFTVAIGAEYREFKPVYIRMGWNSFGNNYRVFDSEDKWAGLSFGAGFDVKKMQISYAVSPMAELGESHRITMTGSF